MHRQRQSLRRRIGGLRQAYLPGSSGPGRKDGARRGPFHHPVREFVEQDAVTVGQLADLGTADAADREGRAAVRPDHGPVGAQNVAQPDHLRPTDGHLRRQPAAAEVLGALVRDRAARVQRDHPVAQHRGLLRVARGDDDVAARDREGAKKRLEPLAAAHGKALGRRVQQQHRGAAQQRGGEGEPTVHARGEGPQAVSRDAGEPGLLQQFVGALQRHPDGGGQHPQMVGGPSTRVADRRPAHREHHPDLALRVTQAPVRPAVEQGGAPPAVQLHHEAQRGALARAPSPSRTVTVPGRASKLRSSRAGGRPRR
ncbi:hypothetical protein GCM10025734_57870 [Kitasatospora paranensis]